MITDWQLAVSLRADGKHISLQFNEQRNPNIANVAKNDARTSLLAV